MLEGSYFVAGLSAAVLIAAIPVWVNLSSGPKLQRLDGTEVPVLDRVEFECRLLIAAATGSAIAALMAVIG